LCAFGHHIQTTEEIKALKVEIGRLRAECDRAKSMPMKYRRMEFNAQLQEEVTKLRAELDALKSSPVPSIPEGYQLVPVEPSEAMVRAGIGHTDLISEYKAMLAAAKEES